MQAFNSHYIGVIKTLLKLLLKAGETPSYSQFGEDAVLASMFRKTKKGVYVDVGGYHPVLYSNTYLFAKRGWKGVVIEPNPKMRSLYKFFRPRDIFMCAGVATHSTVLSYYEYADEAFNTFDKNQIEQVLRKNKVSPIRTIKVQVAPLANLLKDCNLSKIDILSVDVEGMDLDVLKSHDWSMRPRVVVVEAHGFDPDVPHENATYRFLREKKYEMVGKAGLSLIFKDTLF